MSDQELLAKYSRMHAYFMADVRFWYEKGRQEADKIICVLMSDLRAKGCCQPIGAKADRALS